MRMKYHVNMNAAEEAAFMKELEDDDKVWADAMALDWWRELFLMIWLAASWEQDLADNGGGREYDTEKYRTYFAEDMLANAEYDPKRWGWLDHKGRP